MPAYDHVWEIRLRLETILLVLVSSTIKKSWRLTVGCGRSARSRVQATIHALGSGACVAVNVSVERD
jgi:hypothetical protein